MSYPDPIYTGEGGEASATLRPAGHEPELVHANGTRAHFLMTGERVEDDRRGGRRLLPPA